jgi:hypothetical protein
MEEGRATGVRPRTDPTQDKDQDKGQEGPRQGHPRQDKDKTRTPTTSSGVKTRTPTTSSGNGTGHSSIRTLNAVPVSDHDGETLRHFPNFGCPGLHVLASIEEPNAICAILAHFAKHGALEEAHYRPRPRGPPAVAKAA